MHFEREKYETKPEKVESGIPRLDYILKGGFFQGATYTLFGPPGAGKTIFANQLCFNHIERTNGNCVYLTLLSETVAKMVGHLSCMHFFKEEKIPDHLSYVSGYHVAKTEGLEGLLKLVQSVVKTRQATVLVIDSIEAARESASSERDFKEFIHLLQAFTALMRCTTLLISSRCAEEARPENATVDGVLEISDASVGPRSVRELTVLKFRGTDFLRGKHELEITSDGVQIHPRTEIQFSQPPGKAVEDRVRCSFGVKGLDDMTEGGPLSGSATALVGAPGTGKTMLGLTFLSEGARQGQSGVYFGFYEPPPRLIEKARNISLPFEKYVDKGLIEIVWQPPLEHFLDSLAEQLIEKYRGEKKPQERRRLFLDGIEGFRAANVYPDRMPRFLSAFFNQLRMLDVTTLISEELGIFEPDVNVPNPELINVVESVVLLRYVELKSQLYRLLSIMKMRESKYDTSIREFKILDSGIEVAESFKSAESILSGHARERGWS